MPFLVLEFPAFDPVIVSIGPFAIRWYALAYIFGILLGWLYARAMIRNEALVGRQGAADRHRFRRLHRLGHARHHPRRPRRLRAVLQPVLFLAHPGEIFQLWNGGMSFHGGFAGCVLAVVLFAWRRKIPALPLGDLTCAVAPIGLFLGRLANFINGELWGRPTDVPWAMVFPGAGPLPRHPSQLYEAALEGLLLLIVLAIAVRAGALQAAGTDPRAVRNGICDRAQFL